MNSSPNDRPRPGFARMYARVSPGMEQEGMGRLREELLAGVAGEVVEVGAGNGLNFAHYPPTASAVVAVEPEPQLRSLAERTAGQAPVPVSVVAGRAEALPLETASVDVGVVCLVLCALPQEDRGLAELHRVIRPGGELRFLEHAVAQTAAFRAFQRLADATIWPGLTGGCRTARDPLAAFTRAGFEVVRARRVRFPAGRLPVPAAPHVLGTARRP